MVCGVRFFLGAALLIGLVLISFPKPSFAQVTADVALADARNCPSLSFTPPPFPMPSRGPAEMDASYNARVAKAFASFNILQPCVFKTDTGLQIRLLEPSAQTASPPRTEIVLLRYESRLVTGEILDGNLSTDQPARIRMTDAVPAWQEALKHMRIAERWVLYAPPELSVDEDLSAASEQGVIYEIELTGFIDGP